MTENKQRPDVAAKEARQEAFLTALVDKGVQRAACAAAGITRQCVTLWRKDPAFEERFQQSLEDFADSLQEEALRRGRDGYDEPLTYQGQFSYLYRDVLDEDGDPVLSEDGSRMQELVRDSQGQPVKACVRKYSDSLLMRKLEARVKGYARKTEVSGPEGAPLLSESPLEAARKIAFVLALGMREANAPPPANGEDLC